MKSLTRVELVPATHSGGVRAMTWYTTHCSAARSGKDVTCLKWGMSLRNQIINGLTEHGRT